MTTESVTPAASRPAEEGVQRAARRMSKGVMLRAFLYVIGLHVFALFALLIFYVGSHRH